MRIRRDFFVKITLNYTKCELSWYMLCVCHWWEGCTRKHHGSDTECDPTSRELWTKPMLRPRFIHMLTHCVLWKDCVYPNFPDYKVVAETRKKTKPIKAEFHRKGREVGLRHWRFKGLQCTLKVENHHFSSLKTEELYFAQFCSTQLNLDIDCVHTVC